MKRLFLSMLLATGFISTAIAQHTPIMGWSSWNTFALKISDTVIKNQADAMVKTGLKDAGYNYVNIDDGYFGYRDKAGRLHENAQAFPNGMRPVVDYIHSLGLKAGIYTDAGPYTCGSMYDQKKSNNFTGVGTAIYCHEEQDARLFFGDWNFDFIKIDYCGAGELGLDEQQRYTEIVNAFRKCGYGNVSVNICRWAYPGIWAKDIAASWRISGDISDNWNSVKYIIGKNMWLSAFCRDGHFNDMDMLEIGRSLSPAEENTHFGMWCIMSSPLLIGCNMETIPERSLNLMKNKEAIAINQDPLALQAKVVMCDSVKYVFVKDIEQLHGLSRAVAFYNSSDTTVHFSVPASLLELSGKITMRDILLQKNLKSVKGTIEMDVAPHDTKLLKLQGTQRVEPVKYEAEWAYLPLYNDVGRGKRITQAKEMAGASLGEGVINLGGCKENHIEWSDVWSDNGGEYAIEIVCKPRHNSHLEIIINNSEPINLGEVKGDKDGLVTIKSNVTLHKGYNTIRMGCIRWMAPDIDCFTVKPLSAKL